MSRSLITFAVVCGMATSLTTLAQEPAPGMPPIAMPNGGQFDCNSLAAMPNMPMSVDACRQMMSGAQKSAAALADDSAARPGDDAMSCQDIVAEMGTMQGVGLSDQTRNEGVEASTQYQAIVGAQLAQLQKQGEAGAAATTAAAGGDLAVQLATGGLVNPHAAEALQQAALAESKVQGEQMAEERRPAEKRLMNSTGNTTAEMAERLQANPRFARLVNLAMAKDCKEPGDAAKSEPSPLLKGMGLIGR